MSSIGIMGGSFDPIHNGHLFIASEALRLLELERVVFVPTKKTVYKVPIASALDRYNMVSIAIDDNPSFDISAVDIERKSEYTYTIDTINDIVDIYKNKKIYFITGIDALENIKLWKSYNELIKKSIIVGCRRDIYTKLTITDNNILCLHSDSISISSTQCRVRLNNNISVKYLINDKVISYIEEKGLYI